MARADERLSDLATQIARMREDGKPLRASTFGRPVAPPPPASPSRMPTPNPKPELSAVLDLISRAAELLDSHRDHASRTEIRADEAEHRLEAANRQISDLEAKLRIADEEAGRERSRAEDYKLRSTELIEKTQAMLDEASERLLAAEWRAEQSDESFATLRHAVESRFGYGRA